MCRAAGYFGDTETGGRSETANGPVRSLVGPQRERSQLLPVHFHAPVRGFIDHYSKGMFQPLVDELNCVLVAKTTLFVVRVVTGSQHFVSLLFLFVHYSVTQWIPLGVKLSCCVLALSQQVCSKVVEAMSSCVTRLRISLPLRGTCRLPQISLRVSLGSPKVS